MILDINSFFQSYIQWVPAKEIKLPLIFYMVHISAIQSMEFSLIFRMIHMYAIKNIKNKYQNYEKYINLFFFVEYDCSMPDINSFFLYSMGKNLKHVPVSL